MLLSSSTTVTLQGPLLQPLNYRLPHLPSSAPSLAGPGEYKIFFISKIFKIFSDCRGVQHLRPRGRSSPAALQSLQPGLGLGLLAESRPPPHCTHLGRDGLHLQLQGGGGTQVGDLSLVQISDTVLSLVEIMMLFYAIKTYLKAAKAPY